MPADLRDALALVDVDQRRQRDPGVAAEHLG
jgi:hypothetical protein